MAEKTLNTRIQQKHDVELNWNKAINFIPKIGEIIVYDIDENYAYERFKIGDGTKTIVELPFTGITNINGIEPDKNGTVILHANDVKAVTINLEETNEGEPALTNADMLGGIAADQYALKGTMVTSFNGQTGDIVFEGGGISSEFIGATAETDGAAGAVPAPIAGDQDKYLRADGTWSDLPIDQPNWDMNDPTDASYIENRPFYDSRGDHTVVENFTFECSICYDYIFDISKSGTTVIIDDESYSLNYDSFSLVSFRDLSKGKGTATVATAGTYTFYHRVYNSPLYADELMIEGGSSGTHTLTVIQSDGELVKIENKFIPDEIARVEDMILPGEETTTETIGSMDIHVDTADTAYDSEKLGGLLAEEYALKSEIIGLPFLNRIMVSLPSSGWIQEASGRYTQTVVVGDITSHSKCHHVDIDMSGATEENINDIRHAWSLIDIVEATDAGVLFTAFSEAPAVDLSVYIDIEVIKTTIPNANGVIF